MNEENIILMLQPLVHDFICNSEGGKFCAWAKYYIIKIQVRILNLHWYCKEGFALTPSVQKIKKIHPFEKPPVTRNWWRASLCGVSPGSWPWVFLTDGHRYLRRSQAFRMCQASVNKTGTNGSQMQWWVLGAHPMLRNTMVLCHETAALLKACLLRIYLS